MPNRTLSSRRLALVLIALAVCGAGGCRQAAVSEAERELILRAGDLADYDIEVADAARHEKFSKTVYFDGSADIDYEYDPPEGALYLNITVTFEKSERDARASKALENTGLKIGAGIGGLKLEERKDFFRYGDDSSFYVLTKDGQPVGNYFVTREGAKVYSAAVIGAYFSEPAEWAALITPKLQKFSAHKP